MHTSPSEKLRWGILGAANIARKNWRALARTGNSTVVAVASRDFARARSFVADCQAEEPFDSVPEALDSYEKLIARPDVDAVYVPLPTTPRTEWVLKAAAAGKHIVCEKPCAATVEDLREILAACEKSRVQFMDGVMFVHGHRLEKMRQVLDDQRTVGPLKRITSTFCFLGSKEFFDTNIRTQASLEPTGCLGDLGWYNIKLTLWAMNWQLPHAVTGRQLDAGRTGVPLEFSGEMFFDGGVSASFYCSFQTANEQWATLTGSNGYLHVRDFVLPFAGDEATFATESSVWEPVGCDFKMKSQFRHYSSKEPSHGHPTSQEVNEFRNFSAAVLSGRLNTEWPDQALKTQIVMNACLESARHRGKEVKL